MPLKDLEIRALRPQERIYKRTDERGLYIEAHPTGSSLKLLAVERQTLVPLVD